MCGGRKASERASETSSSIDCPRTVCALSRTTSVQCAAVPHSYSAHFDDDITHSLYSTSHTGEGAGSGGGKEEKARNGDCF